MESIELPKRSLGLWEEREFLGVTILNITKQPETFAGDGNPSHILRKVVTKDLVMIEAQMQLEGVGENCSEETTDSNEKDEIEDSS